MEPKFQSSFIPKGPVASSGNPAPDRSRGKNLLGLIASVIFVLAVVLSLGVFGYNSYLSYRISQTGGEIETARAQVDSDAIHELIRLESRISSTETLLDSHIVLSPLFDFLEDSTLQSVRFLEFDYNNTNEGMQLVIAGEARGYSAVALQSEEFTDSQYFKNLVFSDLRLNEAGNVAFSLRTDIDPSMLSFSRIVERESLMSQPEISDPDQAELDQEGEIEEASTSTQTSI